MTKLTPLNKDQHKNLRVNVPHPFSLAKEHHVLPIFTAEFANAGAEYPLVFVKDNETGVMRSVVLTGLKPNENLFFTDTGWLGKYAPISSRPSPIAVIPKSEEDEQLFVCIDESSSLLSEKEGERLFEDDGTQTKYLREHSQLAADIRTFVIQTKEFIDTLLELKLIKSNALSVEIDGKEPYDLTGLYIIDQEALTKLTDVQFLELRQRNYLAPIYASIASMNRLDHLLYMHTNKTS